jgi:predicted tellurium resistance membrane protein TerC
MGAYDPNTGFRNGSFAQRNPRAYFAMMGALYVVIWFGLSMFGHHAKTAGFIAAALIAAIVFGVLTAGLHYATWRWRTKRGQPASQ